MVSGEYLYSQQQNINPCLKNLLTTNLRQSEVEAKTYLQAELGAVVVDIPIYSRLKGYGLGQEESIAGFEAKREFGVILVFSPIPTVDIHIGTQIDTHAVDIVTTANTERIKVDIGTTLIPTGTGMNQQSYIVEQESTAMCLKSEARSVSTRIVTEFQTCDRGVDYPFSFLKLCLSRYCGNKQAN